jgi:hypothetical protein
VISLHKNYTNVHAYSFVVSVFSKQNYKHRDEKNDAINDTRLRDAVNYRYISTRDTDYGNA